MNNRIREFRAARGWSLQRLAEEAGTSKGQIDKLEKGARRLTSDWMVRLGKALGCDPRDFFPTVLPSPRGRGRGWGSEAGRKISGKKTNAANADGPPPYPSPRGGGKSGGLIPVRDAAGRTVDHVPRPYYLAHAEDAWALALAEDAMAPMYRPRQILFVNPYRAPAAGNGVVIVPRKGAMRVREFVSSGPKSVTLREYHPKKREITLMLRDIKAMHTVVGTVEG